MTTPAHGSSSASHRAMFNSLNIPIIYGCTLYITRPYLLPPCWSILLGRIYAFHILWFITPVDELPTIYDAHKVYNSICSKVGFLWSCSFSPSTLTSPPTPQPSLVPNGRKLIQSYTWSIVVLSWLSNRWSFAFFERRSASFLSVQICLADWCDEIAKKYCVTMVIVVELRERYTAFMCTPKIHNTAKDVVFCQPLYTCY